MDRSVVRLNQFNIRSYKRDLPRKAIPLGIRFGNSQKQKMVRAYGHTYIHRYIHMYVYIYIYILLVTS